MLISPASSILEPLVTAARPDRYRGAGPSNFPHPPPRAKFPVVSATAACGFVHPPRDHRWVPLFPPPPPSPASLPLLQWFACRLALQVSIVPWYPWYARSLRPPRYRPRRSCRHRLRLRRPSYHVLITAVLLQRARDGASTPRAPSKMPNLNP